MKTTMIFGLLLAILPGCVDGTALDTVYCDAGEPCYTLQVAPPVECGAVACGGMCGTAWECQKTASGVPVCVVTEELPGKDDGNLCTHDICNTNGTTWAHIVVAPNEIDDGDPCTIDECAPATGIYHVDTCS